MQHLLTPDVGLMFWTIVTFLLTVFILRKVAWGPFLKVIDEREARIKLEMETTQKNREEMERLKKEYEDQLLTIESRAKALLAQAQSEGVRAKETILKEAQDSARKLTDKTQQQLEVEKERLIRELRNEAGSLSVQLAEKLMKQSVDEKVQERILQDFMKSLESGEKVS